MLSCVGGGGCEEEGLGEGPVGEVWGDAVVEFWHRGGVCGVVMA